MLKSNLGLISILFASYPLLVSGQYASSLPSTTSAASVTSVSDASFSIIASSSSTAGTAGLPSASPSLQTPASDILTSTIPILPPSTAPTTSAVSTISSLQSTTPSLTLTTALTSKSVPPSQSASGSSISTSSSLSANTEPFPTTSDSSSSPLSSGSQASITLQSSSSSFISSSSPVAAQPTMASSSSSNPKQQKTIIALAVVLGVALLALLLCLGLFIRRRIQKRMQITKTGNPVLDEEIETWRASKGVPEGTLLTGGDHRSSTSQREWTDEKILSRPVTAKAPNARSGLTDSTVPGEEPFVKVRRNSARLQKRPGSRPSSLLGHQRSQSSFSDREKFRLSGERPKTSDRPTTPHQPVLENLAEKEAPPLPEGAEKSIRDRTSGSIVSKRTSDGSHKKRVSS